MKELLKIAAIPLAFLLALAVAAVPILISLLQFVPYFSQSSLFIQILLLIGGMFMLCCGVVAVAMITLHGLRLHYGPALREDQTYAAVYSRVTRELAWDEQIMRRAAHHAAQNAAAYGGATYSAPARLPARAADTQVALAAAPEPAPQRGKLVYVPFPTTPEPPEI